MANILVIDDEAVLLDLIANTLRLGGHDVTPLCSGTVVEVATLGFFPRTYFGTLQDRSLVSLCIDLKHRLRQGAEIATVIDDELICGRVEYAVPIPDAIKTGIQIRYTIRRSDSGSDLSRLADVLGRPDPDRGAPSHMDA